MSQPRRQINGSPSQSAHDDSAPHTARELLDETARLRGDIRALAETGQRTVRDWRRYVRQRVEEQPYATVLVAAGFGYVLGGGLPVSLVRVALGIGSRLAAERVLSQVARTLLETPSKPS